MRRLFKFLGKYRKVIVNIVTLGVFIWMGWYLYENRSVFESLKNIDVSSMLIVVITMITTVYLNAVLNRRIIKLLGKNVSLEESIHLQYANNFLNKIVTKGGAIFRAYYLKKKFDLAYSRYASTLAGIYVISFLSYGLLGLVSLIMIYLKYGVFNIVMVIFFAGLLLSMLFLLLFKKDIPIKRETRIGNMLVNLLDGWDAIRKSSKEVFILLMLTVLILLLTIIQTIVLYGALGADVGFAESMYMSTVNVITIFLNFTPDGIGVKEGVYVFSSQLINLEADLILLGSLIGRAIALIISVILGGISYIILTKRLGVKKVDSSKISSLFSK